MIYLIGDQTMFHSVFCQRISDIRKYRGAEGVTMIFDNLTGGNNRSEITIIAAA